MAELRRKMGEGLPEIPGVDLMVREREWWRQRQNEGRKVASAQKHFNKINVDYRMVTDTTPEWYQPYNYHELMETQLPYDEAENEG